MLPAGRTAFAEEGDIYISENKEPRRSQFLLQHLSKVTIFFLSLPNSFDLKYILFLSSRKVCEISQPLGPKSSLELSTLRWGYVFICRSPHSWGLWVWFEAGTEADLCVRPRTRRGSWQVCWMNAPRKIERKACDSKAVLCWFTHLLFVCSLYHV